jgi:medium-chain acyl-[acyl-carrier-protein] hydrolase
MTHTVSASSPQRHGGRVVDRPDMDARLRLFCFPYAGGSAQAFRPWLKVAPTGIAICPVHLPGRERRFRDQRYTRLAPLAMELCAELRPYLDQPFAFFGHSMGAVIAFEIARMLEREAAGPAYLFVSGRKSPACPPDDELIHMLPDDRFVARLRELDGTPEEVLQHPEILELMLPVLRADFAMCETYSYGEGQVLSCPISAFGGTGDTHVTRDELIAWHAQTSGAFSLRLFPGGHFFLHDVQADVLRAVVHDLQGASSTL